MLVLVKKTFSFRFGRLVIAALAIFACWLHVYPTLVSAQTNWETNTQNSILVQSDVSNPATSSGANGVARIDPGPNSQQGQATFTARVFSPAPEPPQDLLMPASPTEESFTRPLVNELRGESVESAAKPETRNDGSQAIGTFATTNQHWQDSLSANNQVSQGQTDRFSQGSGFQTPEVNPNQFGNASAQSSRNSNGFPPITSRSEFAEQQTPLRNELRQDSTPAQNNRSVRSFNPPANSMQPLGQNFQQDNLVRPAGFSQLAPQQNTTDLAKSLMDRYSLDNFPEGIPGQPVKMIEMLRQPISIQQRRPMVNQFWLTYYDWANFVSAKKHQRWLSQITTAPSLSDKAMLEAAVAVSGNRVLAAEIQLGKSQSQLRQYMPNSQLDLLPLPNDLPLIQKYRTNYEVYKSRQMLPTSLLGIDQMLPKTLELIMQRADAVQLAERAAQQVLAALPARQATIATVLEAGRVWRSAEQDLVASVVDYNQAIGDYSLSISHGYQSPEQVASMLIAKPKVQSIARANTQPQSQFRDFQTPPQDSNQRFGTRQTDPSQFLRDTQREQTRQSIADQQRASFGAQRDPFAGNAQGSTQQASRGSFGAEGAQSSPQSRFNLNANGFQGDQTSGQTTTPPAAMNFNGSGSTTQGGFSPMIQK